MPTIPIHTHPSIQCPTTSPSPLPQLLQTPSGLALLELQGTINMPDPDPSSTEDFVTPIGRLVFPDYNPTLGLEDKTWMKRVHLYVGKHQRLTGEVKKLTHPTALIRRRGGDAKLEQEEAVEGQEDLEILEVVRWKVVFSNRPEPVGS